MPSSAAVAAPASRVADGVRRSTRRTATLGASLSAAVTLAFVGGDLVHRISGGVVSAPASRWKIDEDGSFAEVTAWVAMLGAAVLLVLSARRTTRPAILWAWAGLLLLVTADDALQIHETGGAAVVRALGLRPAHGLDAQGWGELVVWGLLGVVSLTALVAAWVCSGTAARRVSLHLLGVVAVLGASAVGVDMVAIVVEPAVDGAQSWVIAMLESSGELFAAGLFATVTWCFWSTRRDPAR